METCSGPTRRMRRTRGEWDARGVRVLLLAAGLVLTSGMPLAAQDFSGAEKAAAPQSEAMQAANEALVARDWVKAVKLLQPLAAADPQNAQVLYDLGSAQDALEQETAAEQSYRAAILDAGGYLEPRLALGLLLARAGRMEDARAELGAAAAITNGDKLLRARALRAMARIDEKTRPGEARDELLAALSLSPETPEDTLMAAELAQGASNGRDAAEAAYRRLLEKTPQNAAGTAALAHLLVTEKRYAEAEKLLTEGLAAHPQDEAMTIQLAAAYTAEGKSAQAAPLVEALHAANPGEENVSRLLAELYVNTKEWEKAEPLLSTLTEQHPQDGDLVDLRAQALMHLHQDAEGERILARVIPDPALFSNTAAWADAAADLAFCASANDDPGVVLQVLANRAKVLPPSAPILFLTAISEDKLHRGKEAVQAYEQFLAASNGANPNEEFEARHRLVALQHRK